MADQKVCSRIELPSVPNFLVAEGCKPVEIHRRMSAVYGATCFSRKKVHKWANLLKEGLSSVEDEDRPGATVSDWLRHQSKDFCSEGIRKVVHRREKCETVLRDYVDK